MRIAISRLAMIVGMLSAMLPMGAQEAQVTQEDQVVQAPMENETLPVYYQGSGALASVLQKKSFKVDAVVTADDAPFLARRSQNPRHMLIVEGSALADGRVLKDEILAGNPVIIIGGNARIKKLIGEQIVSGKNAHERPIDGLFSTEYVSQAPDGTILKESASGYFVASDGFTYSWATCEKDSIHAAELAYNWALDSIVGDQNRRTAKATRAMVTATSPWWQDVAQKNYTTGNSWSPAGVLNLRDIYKKLVSDGSSSNDWYGVDVQQQTIPGYSKWGNKYCNATLYTEIHADAKYGDRLYKYAPTTTSSGTTSVSVNLTASYPLVGSVSLGWSYSTPNTWVEDKSNFADQKAAWYHHMDSAQAVGRSTYMIMPGATVMVPNNAVNPWNRAYYEWKAQYAWRVAVWYWTGWYKLYTNPI